MCVRARVRTCSRNGRKAEYLGQRSSLAFLFSMELNWVVWLIRVDQRCCEKILANCRSMKFAMYYHGMLAWDKQNFIEK